MAQREKEYRRLPGVGGRRTQFLSVLATRSRLWLGKDHLLAVENQGYSENYKRFYFKDIQAIVVRYTVRSMVFSVILGICAIALLLLALLMMSDNEAGAAMFFFCSAGFFAGAVLINYLLGPSCICHLRTAVQIEELPSLQRVPRVRRVLGIIRPLIEQAQGVLDYNALREEISGAPREDSGEPRPPVPGSDGTPGVAHRLYSRKIHGWLFSLFLLAGFFNLLYIFVQGVSLVIVGALVTVALAVLAILALVWGYQVGISSRIKGLSWAAAVYVILSVLSGYVQNLVVAFKDPETAGNQWMVLKATVSYSPMESIPLLILYGFFACSALVLAGLELMAFREQPGRAMPDED